jgi:SAM-dependent methyltransferase
MTTGMTSAGPASSPAHDDRQPSPWIERFAHLVAGGATVLDVAAGRGRHARYFAARGARVVAVDRDADALAALHGVDGVEVVVADLESQRWPFGDRKFDAVVVANYLHRPLLATLVAAMHADAVLLYDTFAVGQPQFGRPSNPDFLLRAGELLDVVRGSLTIVAFEQGRVDERVASVRQRLAAVGPRRARPQPVAAAPLPGALRRD